MSVNQTEANAPGMRREGFIPLAVPNIGELEREYVLKAVESGFVSTVGPYVAQFEERFAEFVGAKYAVACSTGTAGIHLALRLFGVEPGDDVMLSDFTFVGSVNPVAYQHARSTFVDSERITWNLDPELVAAELDRRAARGEAMPKLVEVVHVLGQPALIEPILQACDRNGVPVIEDAAESLGSRWTAGRFAGKQTGTVGRVGCFSFNGNKIATTGGGGMLVTDDEALAVRAKHLSTQAKVPDVGYLHDDIGYNYRLTNIAAALGLAQLERLPSFLDAKHRIADRYNTAFAQTPLTLPPNLADAESNNWLYSVLVPAERGGRDGLMEHLRNRQIDARALWRPLHLQPPFADAAVLGGGAVGEDFFERGLSLPCATELSESDQERVIQAVLEYF